MEKTFNANSTSLGFCWHKEPKSILGYIFSLLLHFLMNFEQMPGMNFLFISWLLQSVWSNGGKKSDCLLYIFVPQLLQSLSSICLKVHLVLSVLSHSCNCLLYLSLSMSGRKLRFTYSAFVGHLAVWPVSLSLTLTNIAWSFLMISAVWLVLDFGALPLSTENCVNRWFYDHCKANSLYE